MPDDLTQRKTGVTPTDYALGPLRLDTQTGLLSGPEGRAHLPPRTRWILARLLWHPQALVGVSDLIAAMCPDPDDEPDSAPIQLRQQMVRIRALLRATAGAAVQLRCERQVGYAVELPRPRPQSHAA